MKTKLCKCSHLKADHSKYFKLCDKCQCSDFVKSKSGLDKLMMGYYIIMIGIMITLSVMIFVLIDSMPDEYMDQAFIITPRMNILHRLSVKIQLLSNFQDKTV